MKLRRLEFAVIALTFAFVCFMGGYFTGRRGSVNIVTVDSQYGGSQMLHAGATADISGQALPPGGDTNPTGSDSGDDISAEKALPNGGEASTAQLPETVGAPSGGDGRININNATRSELMDLPGIGSVLAERIVNYRQQNGSFSRIEDIRNVSGIGEKRFEAIQDRITVGQ